MVEKNRKISLEKFVFKFNEAWSAGIKALYNLNLISLDDRELLEILLSTSRLKKSELEMYLLDEARKEFLKMFVCRISELPVLPAMLEYYRLLPVKDNSPSLTFFIENYAKCNLDVGDVQ